MCCISKRDLIAEHYCRYWAKSWIPSAKWVVLIGSYFANLLAAFAKLFLWFDQFGVLCKGIRTWLLPVTQCCSAWFENYSSSILQRWIHHHLGSGKGCRAASGSQEGVTLKRTNSVSVWASLDAKLVCKWGWNFTEICICFINQKPVRFHAKSRALTVVLLLFEIEAAIRLVTRDIFTS